MPANPYSSNDRSMVVARTELKPIESKTLLDLIERSVGT
jgi:hypothetical protein